MKWLARIALVIGAFVLAPLGVGAQIVLPLGPPTLPTTVQPAGNFYQDNLGAFHFVSPWYDSTILGAKFSGDATRPWFTTPFGSGIQATSGAQPNFVCDRNDYFAGGSGLDFCINTALNQGKGVSQKTVGFTPAGSTALTVTANANIAVGQAVFGPGIPNGDTVATYSAGALTITPSATTVDLQPNTPIAFINATNSTPAESSVGNQGTCTSYTTQTATVQTCNGTNGYVFRNAPSADIIEGGNFVCNDQTGLPSLIAGACLGTEDDLVGEDQDTGLSRLVHDWIYAEGGPSPNPATFGYGVRLRPGAANAQWIGQNHATLLNGFFASTMAPIPGVTGGGGGWGSINEAFKCDGGINIGCYDVISGSLQFATTSVALSGQAQIVFALGKNINPGQVVTGSANIPAGTTVLSSYQCGSSNQRSECGSTTNATLVNLSQNLTGNVAGTTTLTFTGTVYDGSQFNGVFNDAFANWINQGATGFLKWGSTNNSGVVADLQGQGEDSSAGEVSYADIQVGVTSNTHGSQVGYINLAPAGGGDVQIGGAGSTGTGGMARTTSPALAGTPTAPTAPPGDNSTKIATTAYVAANSVTAAGLRGYLAGCITSNDGATPNTVIDIAACSAMDDTYAQFMTAVAFTKNMNAAWASGTANGCLDTGSSLAASTAYFIYEIAGSGKTNDYLCSSQAFGTVTYPSGYTLKRALGWVKTDGSSHILAFVQDDDTWYYGSTTLMGQDVNVTNITNTVGALKTLSIPTGLEVQPFFVCIATGAAWWVTSPDQPDFATNATFTTLPGFNQSTNSATFTHAGDIYSNTSGQIRIRPNGTTNTLQCNTYGFRWGRGRLN